MENSEKHFRTNVLLKNIIGKELINDDNIAILELVKNSYDASSPIVEIQFKNLKINDDGSLKDSYTQNSSKVIIQDFGIGMNGNDIEDKWLNIAYSEKKGKNEINGRMLAGAKGVGRFSCDRLGRYLDIYSKKSGSNIFHLKIDWNNFEIEGEIDLEIQDIPVHLNEMTSETFVKETNYKAFSQGTIIEISHLREKWIDYDAKKKLWNKDKILKLRKNLEKLLNPNQEFSDNSFKINLIVEELVDDEKDIVEDYLKVNGQIKNVIFDKLNFTSTSISSNIDANGKFITTTLTDKGRDIFILKEKNYYKELKNINIVLYYLNTYSKIYFARQTGIRSINFGSVFLFINGFRIPPYGDEGDDWLGLGNRKGQGYNRNLGTRELIGRIEVLDTENKFRIVSSREGLVKDKNYSTLTDDFFYLILRRLERFVVEGLDWDRITRKKKNKDIENDIDDLDNDLTAKQIVNNFEKNADLNNLEYASEYEKYSEPQSVKDKRILSLIDTIIGVKKENIIELYINEKLVNELIKIEQNRASDLLKNLINELNEKYIDTTVVTKAIKEANKISENLSDTLEPILNALDFNADSISTANDYKNKSKEFENYIEKLSEQILNLQDKNAKIENERQKAQQERVKAENARRELEDQLHAEKQKNIYLVSTRKSLGSEADIFIHDIKIATYSILKGLDNLLSRVNDKNLSSLELVKRVGDIKIESEKTLKIAQLMTHANFQKEQQTINIVEYILQYINQYKNINDSSSNHDVINFSYNGTDIVFYRKVSVLDLSIIIDNLISNSEKWNAKNIWIDFSLEESKLKVLISDDGNGLTKKFTNNSESIFELGVFDLSPKNGLGSSGIGLYAVRSLLLDMNAEVKFVGNNINLKGASFEIIFK